jgi:hypothetical protein
MSNLIELADQVNQIAELRTGAQPFFAISGFSENIAHTFNYTITPQLHLINNKTYRVVSPILLTSIVHVAYKGLFRIQLCNKGTRNTFVLVDSLLPGQFIEDRSAKNSLFCIQVFDNNKQFP